MDPQPQQTPSTSSDVRTWCVLCHASALLGLFFHFLGHILGPLAVWLIKRGDSPEIDAHGKESLNFQISMLIYDAIAAILCGRRQARSDDICAPFDMPVENTRAVSMHIVDSR